MSHSLLSPSAAARWMKCPASVALGQFVPNTTSAFAQEGTAAHALAETVLQDWIDAVEVHGNRGQSSTDDYLGHEIEGVTVDHEMVENIGEYTERIWVDIDSPDTVETHLEYRVDFSRVVGVENQGGTIDVLVIKRKANGRYRLKVDDLKYGRGVRVEAEENPQLMLYALGALDEWLLVYDIEDVEMTIHQVRLRSETSYIMTVEDLEAFAADAKIIAQDVYALARGTKEGDKLPESKFLPGEKQCQFCPISPCEAQAAYVAHCVNEEFESLEDITPDSLPQLGVASAETLSGWLNSVDLLEKFCKDVRATALAGLMKGKPLPGYKLIRGRPGNRAWGNPEEVEEVMKAMRIKRDDMYDIKVISPTAAEKLLKKAHATQWGKLEPMITRAEGKLNIAPESDKAPAVVIDASAEFTNLE
jgi:hypothetical protein